VVDLLAAEGAHVVIFDSLSTGAALDNLKESLATGRVEMVRGDLRDAAALEGACQGADFVFHLAAARIDQCRSRPDLALGVNITGTFNVLQAALDCGVRKVVYASAAAAYGEPRYVPVDEEHPLEPLGLYAASKAAGEHMGVGFHVEHGLPFIALRFFNIYGPRHDHSGNRSQIVPSWLACLEEGKPPRIFGDGSQTMDFVYIGDAARAVVVAAKSERSLGAYNVCRGVETSAAELAGLLVDLMGSSLRPVFEQGNGAGVRRRCGSPVRAEAELGFLAQVGLEEGLRATIAWRKALCRAA
jgi:UDP-glucose 4-epimerase